MPGRVEHSTFLLRASLEDEVDRLAEYYLHRTWQSLQSEGGGELRRSGRAGRAQRYARLAYILARRAADGPAKGARVERGPGWTMYSPWFFVRQALTDPDNTASDAYAHAEVRARIFAAAISVFPQDMPSNMGLFARLRAHLTHSRVRTATSFILTAVERGSFEPTDLTQFVVAHMLASRGRLAIDVMRRSPFLETADRWSERDEQGLPYRFVPVPDMEPTISVSAMVNQLEGVPIAVPGLDVVLAGGLRQTAAGGLVIRVSGRPGVGKTSFALALGAALAPLGTRTVYMSFEERRDDLLARLDSLRPQWSVAGGGDDDWFTARSIRPDLSADLEEFKATVDAIRRMYIEQVARRSSKEAQRAAEEQASIFNVDLLPPGVSPLLIVLDGVHELVQGAFGQSSGADVGLIGKTSRASRPRGGLEVLRELVEVARESGAIVLLLSGATGEAALSAVDYLVDNVMRLEFETLDELEAQPRRKLVLEKTRHQAASIGAHGVVLSASDGLRIVPRVAARLERGQDRLAYDPGDDQWFDFLRRDDSGGGRTRMRGGIKIFPTSQVLVTGHGTTGKAGFGLRLLLSPIVTRADEERDFTSAQERDGDDDAPSTWLPRRVLVLSFLYPRTFYVRTARRVLRTRRSEPMDSRAEPMASARGDLVDVAVFYPGLLRPEQFLDSVIRRLDAAELAGEPYTGVLVDGLQHVIGRFPFLQEPSSAWPALMELLRRRRVTSVVTYSLEGGATSEPFGTEGTEGVRDVSALLRTVAQSVDYHLDLSPVLQAEIARSDDPDDVLAFDPRVEGEVRVALRVLSAWRQNVPTTEFAWDRQRFTLSRERRVGAAEGRRSSAP